jgi:hypothetical protein
MTYGPLGKAVTDAMPASEADPIGVWAAALSLYSSAISRSVSLENKRPVVVWTVLAGRSAIGRKGYALGTAKGILNPSIGGFLDNRIRDGISSGASLVDMLYNMEADTAGTEGGTDGRTLIIEEEWASVLKGQKRDRNFSTLFRTAWDGKTISNRTKKDGYQTVMRPLLGFHAHITPGEWGKYVSASEALGGSYNRILPVLVERSKMLSYNHEATFKEDKVITDAYRWAVQEKRSMRFSKAAGNRFDALRAEIEDRMADMPDNLSSYMERASEQVHRVSAVLAASEKKTEISKAAVEAAWAFVSYSMYSVEKLVREASSDGSPRGTKSVPELIREILTRYGGEASSTVLLRALGTKGSAAAIREAVAAMGDVEVYKLDTPGRGAKPVMYRLIPEGASVVEDTPPAAVPDRAAKVDVRQTEAKPRRLTVIRSEGTKVKRAVRTKPKQEPATVPAGDPNPFKALL